MNKLQDYNKRNDFIYKNLKNNKKIYYGIDNENFYITDSHVVMKMNKNLFLFNFDILNKVDTKIFANLDNLEYRVSYINKIYLENNRRELCSINLEDGVELSDIRIDNKYLKLFNNYTKLEISKDNDVIRVYEDKDIIGYIFVFKVY